MNKLPQFTAIASLQIRSKRSLAEKAYNLDNAIYPAQALTKATKYQIPGAAGTPIAVPITCTPPCTLLSPDDVSVLMEACHRACAKCWDTGDFNSCAYAFSSWCWNNYHCPVFGPGGGESWGP